MVTSLLFGFLMAIGDCLASNILDGNKVFYLTTAIEGRLKIDDWPMAATLGVIVLVVSGIMIAAIMRVAVVLPGIATSRRPRSHA